jgi:hypothetical protein
MCGRRMEIQGVKNVLENVLLFFFVVVEFLEWNVELWSTRTLTFFLGGSTVGNYGLV